ATKKYRIRFVSGIAPEAILCINFNMNKIADPSYITHVYKAGVCVRLCWCSKDIARTFSVFENGLEVRLDSLLIILWRRSIISRRPWALKRASTRRKKQCNRNAKWDKYGLLHGASLV